MEVVEIPEFGKQQDMFDKKKKFNDFKNVKVEKKDRVHLNGLGYWTKQAFDEAIKTNAIVERNGTWCICTEEKTVFEDEKGHKLPSPYKVRVISQAYLNIKQKYNI